MTTSTDTIITLPTGDAVLADTITSVQAIPAYKSEYDGVASRQSKVLICTTGPTFEVAADTNDTARSARDVIIAEWREALA